MLRTLQTNLTGGAISSDAKDRLDLQVWRNSVRRAENVSIRPQGGASRRHGTAIVAACPLDSAAYQIEAFVFSQNQSYVCLFYAGGMHIYDRVTRTAVWNFTGQPWTQGMVQNRELVVVQSFDTMFIFHKDFETRQVTRYSSVVFGIATIQWGFLDTGSGAMPRMPFQKFLTGNTTVTASAIGPAAGITLTSNVAVFVPGHAGTWMKILTVQAFCTAYVSPTQVVVTLSDPLPNTNPTVDWQEQAFSSVRGWARCGQLHEQRLWIGGGRDTPNTLWGSTTYDPLNFWLGTGQPTDAIKFVAAQDRVAEIKRMVSFRHLQIFTADGEFYAPSPQNGALTPANFSLKQQSAYGIANADARRFDQTTIFISRAANAVREFVYDDVQQSYSADALTFMAKDYIRNPQDLDVAIETETAQEALCLITNGDGTLAVLSKVRRENVGGWMLWTMTDGTYGAFLATGVIEREIWSVVQEYYDPARRWLVVFDRNYRMDFAKKLAAGSPATTWGPFPEHAGKIVDARSGDLYLGRYTVSPAGYIGIDTPVTEIEVGYSFTPLIQPLVQEVQMPDGVTWGQPKRNVSVTIALVDTLSARINNSELPTANASEDPGLAPDRYTGQFKAWLLGVSASSAPIITAPLPLPFNLTTIQTEVEV